MNLRSENLYTALRYSLCTATNGKRDKRLQEMKSFRNGLAGGPEVEDPEEDDDKVHPVPEDVLAAHIMW